jgi:hypothetical protein
MSRMIAKARFDRDPRNRPIPSGEEAFDLNLP